MAAFHRGWLLKVDHAALLSSAFAEYNTATDDTGSWQMLRAYRQPFRGAATACLAAGIEPYDTPPIRLCDVDPTGGQIMVDGEETTVPPAARPFIRALRLEQLAAGAAGDAPLFWDYSYGRVQPFKLVRALNAASRELGVGLVTSRLIVTAANQGTGGGDTGSPSRSGRKYLR